MGVNLVIISLAILAVVGVRGQAAQSYQCPDGWARWQHFCYYFNNASLVTWSQAGDECHDKLGHLLRIETNDEYEFVKHQLLVHPSDGYWTDLNDLAINEPAHSNNSFMWGRDELVSSVVTSHWDKEPKNTDLMDCVAVDVQGACSVQDCARRHAYICEIAKAQGEYCPAYWNSLHTNSDLCYFVSNATNWPDVVNWQEARKRCESMAPFRGQPTRKASLITITTQETQTFLSSQLSIVFYGRQLFWTGLNDIAREGHFIWEDKAQDSAGSANYIVWRQEPNNLGGHEHCGVLQQPGVFGDRNCEDRVNYACRMSLPDNPKLFNLGCGSWTRAGRKCVYVQSSPTHSWLDARQHCTAKGGDLFKIESRDDNLWLGIEAGRRLDDYGYWIGMKVMGQGFMWADGTVVNTGLLSWDREPDSYSNSGEAVACGAMGYDGNFVDMTCHSAKAGVICEVAAQHQSCVGAGWTYFGGSCYLMNTTYLTNSEGVTYCQTSSYDGSGYLFALNTQQEKNWIISKLAELPNGMMMYWSSLVDIDRGNWKWNRFQDQDPVATQKLVTWSHEPNNWKGNEACVQLNLNGMLNDANCDSPTGFICQKMAPAPPATQAPVTQKPNTTPRGRQTPRPTQRPTQRPNQGRTTTVAGPNSASVINMAALPFTFLMTSISSSVAMLRSVL